MKTKAHAVFFSLLYLGLLLGGSGAHAEDFKVVVNPANPVGSLTREELAQMFLRKTQAWRDGSRVLVVDQVEGAKTREAFTRAVLKRSVGEVKSYWQQQIFSGRGTPPPEKASDAQVLSFVVANKGALAYISGDPGPGVKVLSVED